MTSSLATSLALRAPRLPDERNPATVFLARFHPGKSRRAMRNALLLLADVATGSRTDPREVPWHRLTYAHASAIRSSLAARVAPSTANLGLAALRGVVREAWRLGLMKRQDYETILAPKALPLVKGTRLPKGRAINADEIKALVAVVSGESPINARNGALLAICLAGLRRAEVVALDLSDLDLAAGKIRVAGKGNKEREGALTPRMIEFLRRWLAVRGDAPGPLLLPAAGKRASKFVFRRLSEQGIYDILDWLSGRAGVSPPVRPHDLRRTMITLVLDRTGDLRLAQQLAGHESPTTTAIYDRRGFEARREKFASVDPLDV